MMEKGFYHPKRGYWQTTNEPPQHILDGYPEGTVEVPLKPGPDYNWNGSQWEHTPPDPAEALATWRSTADMDKGAFCIGLMRAKVLPPQEAVAASKGEWPATFAASVTGLPIDPDEAQIIWAATARVRRLHPILLALIQQSPLTDADVDAMFGWTG